MSRIAACLLWLSLLVMCDAETVMVTVQSQSQEDMDALTAQIDAAAQGSGPARVTLGAIEATTSRVVDTNGSACFSNR